MAMSRFRLAAMSAGASALLLLSSLAAGVMAETGEVRFAQLYSLTYLPAYIVYEEKLIEKHAARLGLPAPKVTTNKLSSGPAANDALLSGNVDIAMGGITVLLTLWDRTQGTLNVRGIATMVDSPIFLMTVDPRIKSLKDFGEGDRIAVSAVKVTMQALFLNLAAAREWGWDARFKLDPLAVSMSHPMSIQALRTGMTEVKSYAAIIPFNYEVLTASNARQLMTSYEVLGGAHSLSAFWATEAWVKANPKTYEAVLAAFEEAAERIAADREAAARTYAKWEASALPAADVVRIIGTPSEIAFTVTPNRTLMIAETMHKVGLLKTKPAAWTDYFHAGLHNKNGS
jgi:NitT/TauT family transport system substrate-binding protein